MSNENTHLITKTGRSVRQMEPSLHQPIESILSPYSHHQNESRRRHAKRREPSSDLKTLTLRALTWKILHYRASKKRTTWVDKTSYFTEIFVLNLIILNVGVTIWTSASLADPNIDNSVIRSAPYEIFLYFSTVIFTVEYLLRLWACVEDPRFRKPINGRLKWMFLNPLSITDLVALIPFYLELSVDASHSVYRGAMSIRALRLLRLLSFLRLERSYDAIKKVRRIFRKKWEELLIVSYITAMVILISSITIFFLEYEAQPKVFHSIGVGAWWTVETITSVGFGDIVPLTTSGRIFASIVALWGVLLFSIPGAILSSGFIEVMLDHQKQKERQDRETLLRSMLSLREHDFALLQNTSGGSGGDLNLSSPARKINSAAPRSSFTSHSPVSATQKSIDPSMTEKFNYLIDNQRLLEHQMQLQREQLDTIIYLLRHSTHSTSSSNDSSREE